MPDWFDLLTVDGYALLPAVFAPAEVEAARRGCAAALAGHVGDPAVLARDGHEPHGARDLIRLWPAAVGLARAPALAAAVMRVLGPGAGLVRGLYFDKPPGQGWALPWHRDTAVAVSGHDRAGPFGKPTFKSGVPHVEAAPELLARMLSARIHLDAMTDSNGPLRVAPGSHADHSRGEPDDRAGVTLYCDAGDVLLMRPLLLHASTHCPPDHGGHRRIVHLEFAADPHPAAGFEWHMFIPVGDGRIS